MAAGGEPPRVVEALADGYVGTARCASLVVGWNSNLHEDPAPLLLASFELATEEPCGRRRTFAPEETHIYDFYRRRKDQ